MAQSGKRHNQNNPLLRGVSGKIGNVVIRQTAHGIVLANAPRKSSRKPNQQEMAIRNRFSDAAEYARRQLQYHTTKEMYQAKVNPKLNSAYVVAVKDFLSPPKILNLDITRYHGKIGNPIIVDAEDDFRVNLVRITIKDASGKTIERGQASRRISYSDQWIYIASVKNDLLPGSSITARAEDLPGNQATATATIPESLH